MDLELTNGEQAVLIDGLYGDVSFRWVVDRLGCYTTSIPDSAVRDRAFESLERLLTAGLIVVGRVEALPGEPPATRHPLRVPRVRHVAEPLDVVRARVDNECADGAHQEWGWTAFAVATDEGRDVAQSILDARPILEVIVDGIATTRSSANLTGRLEIKDAESSFPGPEWSDFVMPLVPMLVGTLNLAYRGTPGSVRFMDGPYELRFEAAGSMVSVKGSHDRPGMRPRVAFESMAPWIVWLLALDGAIDAIAKGCRAIGHDDPTVAESLRSARICLEGMEQALARHT